MPALFVDHLTVMDFSYVHPQRGILGESWIVDVQLAGALDEQGMVFDFGHVKKQIKKTIDDLYDHRLLVPQGLREFQAVQLEDQLELDWQDSEGRHYSHSSPHSAVVLLSCQQVTPAVITPLIERQLVRLLPDNVEQVRINIRPEAIEGAFYHYSHGLKKHQGNCQRIAHGHRSRIEIHMDGERSPTLEQQWASRWNDIYIGTREDLSKTHTENGVSYFTFSYESQQGLFELTLPEKRCYLIDTDSTVEHLADHIATEIKKEHPDKTVSVRAFEGVWKGALVEI